MLDGDLQVRMSRLSPQSPLYVNSVVLARGNPDAARLTHETGKHFITVVLRMSSVDCRLQRQNAVGQQHRGAQIEQDEREHPRDQQEGDAFARTGQTRGPDLFGNEAE